MPRVWIGLAILITILGAVLFLTREPAKPSPKPKPEPIGTALPKDPKETPPGTNPAAPPANLKGHGNRDLYIGSSEVLRTRRIQTVLTTRKGATPYQALIRYQPHLAAVETLPGLNDLRALFGRQLPAQIVRVDQETEALIDNLGEPLQSITSAHYYLNPDNPGQVIAYDLANTTGGQAQRFVGHLTRSGITVDVYRGREFLDRHDLPFQVRNTFVPLEMEFIHQWYKGNPEALATREQVKFSIFIPDVMGFVLLVAKPLGNQFIPVKDKNYNCAHYEVITVSTQAEGLQARQEMWFSLEADTKDLLLKREDYDASMNPGEAPVTERSALDLLSEIRELVVRPPEVPFTRFPYEPEREYVYHVRAKDKPLGKISVVYSRAPDEMKRKTGAAFNSKASVEFNGKGAERHELAGTWYDREWHALQYDAAGEEVTDGTARYTVATRLADGRIDINLSREPVAPAAPAVGPASLPAVAKPAKLKEPLERVAINDEDAPAPEKPEVRAYQTRQQISRPLSGGTFLFDYNRVEHLAALACRFPLPPVPKDEAGETPRSVFQKAAIFSVRQNRCGVILFEISPETKPVLTERQKLRQTQAERDEPRLFTVKADAALLPCRMLLTPDGRMLELTLKVGSSEVTYTLDDPITRARAERLKKQRLQEGPQLIRPPWW